jgi:hypothetical protein
MQGEAAASKVGLRGTCLPRGTSNNSSSIRVSMKFFDPIFEAALGGLLVFKIDHAWYRWKVREVYLPTI